MANNVKEIDLTKGGEIAIIDGTFGVGAAEGQDHVIIVADRGVSIALPKTLLYKDIDDDKQPTGVITALSADLSPSYPALKVGGTDPHKYEVRLLRRTEGRTTVAIANLSSPTEPIAVSFISTLPKAKETLRRKFR